ncbi:uncharacterized protein [Bemisia tabaci]|uniref:uncharacterized protein n=1 Tax=Bemisia tabaci TaxID=7038 RepID=UPI003B280FBD
MLQICRTCEQFTVTSVFLLRLHIVLSRSSGVPESIIFFENKDFLGDRCEIEVEGCKPMCPGMERKASSLQGNATCAHFYREENCVSYIGPWYAAVDPYEDLKWSIGQDFIVSVGDCSQPMDPINSITFYEDEDYHGKRCNIQMPSKGCQPMCPDLDKQASSAFGSEVGCVKMYNEPNCEGFLGILDLTGPVSEPDFKSTTLQDSISSIGDCSNSSISLYEHKYLGGKRCDIRVRLIEEIKNDEF